MLAQDLRTKKCIMVCGGGGVGKTTTAAALAVAATRLRKRVLVVTIDPAKRLAEAFGFSIQELLSGGEPKRITGETKRQLEIPEGSDLDVGILNPKYVLGQILEQVLSPPQRERLVGTVLYQQLSEMVYGLQEYTAYEWVTRMIQGGQYDLIILDTPPAFHAKDFFNVPQKIENLMQSRVFQIFVPKKTGMLASLFGGALSFPWIEKLLGGRIFSESRLFFETFQALRERILERCQWLARFFKEEWVSVVAVGTVETGALLELEGLQKFLKSKSIELKSMVINQVEQAPDAAQAGGSVDRQAWLQALQDRDPLLLKKWQELEQLQKARADRAIEKMDQLRHKLNAIGAPGIEVLPLPMVYAEDSLEILVQTARRVV